MNHVRLRKGWALALVGLMVVAAACSKKSSSSSSGGGPVAGSPGGGGGNASAPSPFLGTWNFSSNSTTDNGRCETYASQVKGVTEVDSAGNFTFQALYDPAVTYSGSIDLNTGGVSFSSAGRGDCGPQSGSGTCTSGTSCSGSYAAGQSTGAYVGNFTLTR